MQAEASLESYFNQVLRTSFVDQLGLNDPEIIEYVAHLLCEFAEPDNLYRLKDAGGRRLKTMAEMLSAADPVYGSAASFEAERTARKYLGDFAMFVAGMHLDVMESGPNFEADRGTVDELIRVGEESYYIVSQFNVFEYEDEAPLYARLSSSLDRCILGLALVREELNKMRVEGAERN